MNEDQILPKENVRVRAPFVKAKCPDCGNDQIVFSRPATPVNCSICGAVLATPTGGRGNFRAATSPVEA